MYVDIYIYREREINWGVNNIMINENKQIKEQTANIYCILLGQQSVEIYT